VISEGGGEVSGTRAVMKAVWCREENSGVWIGLNVDGGVAGRLDACSWCREL
jgi:hypothetical protein